MRRLNRRGGGAFVRSAEGEQGFWPSYADMMSAVALILFFLMLLSYIQNLITGNDLQNTQEVLAETRFKAKLLRNMIAAVAVWLVAMAVLFGVPVAYGYMTDHQKELCRRHAKQYKAVSDKKAKVKLVRKYSDHSRGALEIMKAVSDRLPAGVTLSSWDFTRDDGVRLRAESDDSSSAYQLKDALAEMCAEGEDGEDGEGEKIFEVVRLGALSKQKDGKQKFEIECRHKTEEE